MKFNNLINGREFSLGQFVKVKSRFYPDYSSEIMNSTRLDLEKAVNSAVKSQEELNKLTFEDRKKIMTEVAKKLDFTEEDREHCIKMIGLPRKRIDQYLNMILGLLTAIPKAVESRFDIVGGKAGREYNDINFVEIKVPESGFLYSVVPGNDPRATAFVASFSVIAGIPAVLKISKNEVPIATKFVKALINAGYPTGAINLVLWDTSGKYSERKHFFLCKKAKIVMPFGDDNTVEKLRYKQINAVSAKVLLKNEGKQITKDFIEESQQKIKIDYFNNKALCHMTGNSAMIVTADADIDKIIPILLYSAYHNPNSCQAAKGAYIDKEVYDEVMKKISDAAGKLKTGDPLDKETDIGYVEDTTLTTVFNRVNTLQKFGQLVKKHGERTSNYQSSPLLLETMDHNSEFLMNEIAAYILTIKKCKGTHDLIASCNVAAERKPRLGISIFTENRDSLNEFYEKLNANLIHLNQPTNFWHGCIHYGFNYIESLSWTKSVYLGNKKV